ncbi:MAG TPA: nuclear transport factor 2 family protein, partial [Reyranella sp.]|nr:nuclear transport factor 2 family protein [Reyranella sp.]
AVAEAIAALTKAMLAADKAKLESLLSDNLSYGHSSGKIETKKEVVDVVASKKTVYKSIELSKQTVAVAGNDAIVRHACESESGTGDGKWNVAKIGVLQVWAKEGGSWKLLARQAFRTS